jgi:hypothetical protein
MLGSQLKPLDEVERFLSKLRFEKRGENGLFGFEWDSSILKSGDGGSRAASNLLIQSYIKQKVFALKLFPQENGQDNIVRLG